MKKYEQFKKTFDEQPELWNKQINEINFAFEPVTTADDEGEEVTQHVGYSIPLSGHMDYGHIKSQIIKHVYPDKDVDALINNALHVLLTSTEDNRTESQAQDVSDFLEFSEWRAIAGDAAKELIESLQ